MAEDRKQPPETVRSRPRSRARSREGWIILALSLVVICLLRWDATRLPFYWDELGFYAPFTRTIYEKGLFHLDQQWQALFFVHPPFFYALIAGAAKALGWSLGLFRFFSFVAMSAYVTCAYLLARRWVRPETAGAMALALLLAPVSVSEGGMIHADLPAAAFGLGALLLASRGRLKWASAAYLCGVMTNIPLLFMAPAFLPFLWDSEGAKFPRSRARRLLGAALFFAPAALASVAWYFWIHAVNAEGTTAFPGNAHLMFSFLDGPVFLLKRFAHRIWQIFFADARWALTVAIAAALALGSLTIVELRKGRLALSLIILLAVETLCLALFGATHQRYAMVAIAGLFILGARAFERLSEKTDKKQTAPARNRLAAVLLALVGGAGLTTWFDPPNKYAAPEYRSAYRAEVTLAEELAERFEFRKEHPLILARWPLSDALSRPFLFYVDSPMNVARLDDYVPPYGKPGALEELLKANPGPKFLVTLDHEADLPPEVAEKVKQLQSTIFAGGCTVEGEGEAKAQLCQATVRPRQN